MDVPGMLHVTMQPKPGLSPDQFHEWYNNEHGPTRLRLGHIFPNGLRYKATDGAEPTFLAIYDITSMAQLETPTYTSLRANRSPREAATIAEVAVDRRFYDRVASSQSPLFRPIEQLTDEEAAGLVLISAEVTLQKVDGAEEAVRKWYEEEHIPMLSKVPGWLRTRVFRTSTLDGSGAVKIISLHDYAKTNGLGGPEHAASMSTPRRSDIFFRYIVGKARRTYSLFYVFGPAPRDLDSLSRLPAGKAAFTSADGRTTTSSAPSPVITSFVTAADGLAIPYRLEGNPSPSAPTVAFCNSLLTSLHMWDPLVAILKAQRPDLRILRYDARGRGKLPSPPTPATLEILADDLAALLTALRVPRLHALVGVSMGGATALKFAMRHSARVERFVACDFNAAGAPANTAAWKERIGVAEGPGEGGESGIATLAKATVGRWFHPNTMTEKEDVARWMTEMVAANDVEGFKYSCQALWDYDMKAAMKECPVPGLFVVGEADGKGALVKAMDSFRGNLGQAGAELKIVPLAGHLPMCECPREFWEAIQRFL